MPGTSQLDWLISMTAMIVLFWSRATRDLLKSLGWGIAGTPSIDARDEVAIPRRPPHSVSRSLWRDYGRSGPLRLSGIEVTEERQCAQAGPTVRIRFPPARSQQRTAGRVLIDLLINPAAPVPAAARIAGRRKHRCRAWSPSFGDGESSL